MTSSELTTEVTIYLQKRSLRWVNNLQTIITAIKECNFEPRADHEKYGHHYTSGLSLISKYLYVKLIAI